MQGMTVESKVLNVSEEFSLLKYPEEIKVLFKFCRTHCEIFKRMLSIVLKKKLIGFLPKKLCRKIAMRRRYVKEKAASLERELFGRKKKKKLFNLTEVQLWSM